MRFGQTDPLSGNESSSFGVPFCSMYENIRPTYASTHGSPFQQPTKMLSCAHRDTADVFTTTAIIIRDLSKLETHGRSVGGELVKSGAEGPCSETLCRISQGRAGCVCPVRRSSQSCCIKNEEEQYIRHNHICVGRIGA